jgi:signal transduction histidine kinase
MRSPNGQAVFDDSVRNLLRAAQADARATRPGLFRNLSDLLMRHRGDSAVREQALELLERLQTKVDLRTRQSVAAQVSRQPDPPIDLVALFLADSGEVAGELAGRVRLADADWLALVPVLGWQARARLAERADISPAVLEEIERCGGLRPLLAAPEGAELLLGAEQTLKPLAPAETIAQAETGAHAQTGGEAEIGTQPGATPLPTTLPEIGSPASAHLTPEHALAYRLMQEAMSPGPEPSAWSVLTNQSLHLRPASVDIAVRISIEDGVADAPSPDNAASDAQPEDPHVHFLAMPVANDPLPSSSAPQADAPAMRPAPALDIQEGAVARIGAKAAPPVPDTLSLADVTAGIEEDPASLDDDQVRRLLERIEAFRKRKSDPRSAQTASSAALDRAETATPAPSPARAAAGGAPIIPLRRFPGVPPFAEAEAQRQQATIATRAIGDIAIAASDWRWEADRFAIVTSVEGAPWLTPEATSALRALIGHSLLSLTHKDGETSIVERNFRRRAPFRNQAIALSGEALSGVWLLSGVPFFEPRTGLFQGYRGVGLRQPEGLDLSRPTRALHDERGLYGTGVPTETLSALAHELREPLNAIMGFAQMINQEVMGAVPEVYRHQASDILDASDRVLKTLDDVTDVGRLERGKMVFAKTRFRPADVLETTVEQCQPMAREGQVFLVTRVGLGVPLIWGDEPAVQRCLVRLIATAVAAAQPGETIVAACQAGRDDTVRFHVSRPRLLQAEEADQLLDPLYRPDGTASLQEFEQSAGPTAQGLGLGFGLRLVRQMANAMGGDFELEIGAFVMTIPAAPYANLHSAQQAG